MASNSPTLSPTSKVARAEASSADDDAFCAQTRRCNQAFIESITNAIKQCPHADLTSIMHKYDDYRDRLIDEEKTLVTESITFPSPKPEDLEEGVEEEMEKEYQKLKAASSVSFSTGKGGENLSVGSCSTDEKKVNGITAGVKKAKIKV